MAASAQQVFGDGGSEGGCILPVSGAFYRRFPVVCLPAFRVHFPEKKSVAPVLFLDHCPTGSYGNRQILSDMGVRLRMCNLIGFAAV